MCEKGMEAGGGSTWQEITLITGYISVGEFEPMGCVSKRLKLVWDSSQWKNGSGLFNNRVHIIDIAMPQLSK
jgi:hypothetical protein